MLAIAFIFLWASGGIRAESALNVDALAGVIGYRRIGDGECSVCFGEREEDCFVFNSGTCEFYMDTSKVISRDVNLPSIPTTYKDPQLNADVNSLLYSVMETGFSEMSSGTIFGECMPYVSTYTSCNKENTCVGCKRCECDAWGRWNCTYGRECRADVLQCTANHETIVNVIDSLNGGDSNARKKRSLDKWDKSAASFEEPNIDRIYHDKPSLETGYNDEYESFIDSFYNEIFQKSKSKKKEKDNKKLLKYVLKTVINNALPEILAQENEDVEHNRLKRWISNKNTESTEPVTAHEEENEKTDTPVEETEKLIEPVDEAEKDDASKTIIFNITATELDEWLSDVHPYVHVEIHNSSVEDVTPFRWKEATPRQMEEVTTVSTVNEFPHTTATIPDKPNYLAFGEAYNNETVEPKNYTRRRPLDPKHSDLDMFYDTNFEDLDATTAKQTGDNLGAVNEFDDLNKHLIQNDNTTTDFVDLLKSANQNELSNEKADLSDKTDYNDLTAVNVMKRDLTSNIINKTKMEADIPKNITDTNSMKDLKDDVLDPIDNILKDKLREIKELLKVRESLSNFIKAHKNGLDKVNKSTILSIYKLEVMPHHHHELNDLRKTNNNTLISKYLLKLKRDMFEVIRDIINIRKLYSNKNQVPPEFNYLIKAMNHYIRKTGFQPKRKNSHDVRHLNTTRRSYNIEDSPQSLIKTRIIKVLEVLDRKKPDHCALMPISSHARRVLKRIIKTNYVDDFAAAGLRIRDPNYNLTSDLKSVSTRWGIMCAQIEKSPIHEKLHNMKRLQFTIANDIAKMKDALSLIEFAKNRRMAPVDNIYGEKVVENIRRSLLELTKSLIHFEKENLANFKMTNMPEKHKKESFLTQIKMMLLKSRKDIMKLFKRKVPKTEIVKVIARKSLDEIKKQKLEETMQKWQANLNIDSKIREKRSPVKDTIRMKSIIPKYLRGKVGTFTRDKKNKGMKNMKENVTVTTAHKMATTESKSTENTTKPIKKVKKKHLKKLTKRFTTKHKKPAMKLAAKSTKHVTTKPTKRFI